MNENIEEYILNVILKKVIHKEGTITYVLKNELESLGLSKIENDFVKLVLQKYHITLLEKPPIRIINEKKEFTKIPLIKNSDNNSKKFTAPETNFKLIKYIESTFIPENLILLQTKNTEKSNFFIRQSDLEKLELTELQKKVLKELLKEKKIYILHDKKQNKSLKNVEYYSSKKNLFLSSNLSKEETKKLVEQYTKTKDQFIKEQLIIGHIKLVKYIAIQLSKQINIETAEIEDIGYEALIQVLDNYNKKKQDFTLFAYKYIEKYIYENLSQTMGLESKRWIVEFIKYKQKVEEETGENVLDNIELLEKIVNEISKKTNVPKDAIEFLRKTMGYSNIEKELETDDKATENIVLNQYREEQLKQEIENILAEFSLKEQDILKHRYGLNGEKLMTNIELARIYGVTQERIRQIEEKALKKLRNPARTKLLRPFYIDDTNEQTHYDLTQNKKR